MTQQTPPPWQQIGGISRADMKDNRYESLVSYDGNARPGELVVDLSTFQLYIGNTQGNLNLVTGGGGGSPGGFNTYVQFNDGGAFGGSSAFTFNKATGVATINTLTATRVTGDLSPSANIVYSLGNTTNRWKDLWLSNSTLYLGNITVSGSANTLTVNGNNVVTTQANGTVNVNTISVVGNITGNNFIGNGAGLTGVSVYSNANVASYLPTYAGNLTANNVSLGNAYIGGNTPGAYYVSATASGVSLGQYATQSVNFDGSGITVAGTGGVTIQGAAGATVRLGGGTSGNIVVSNVMTLTSASASGTITAGYFYGDGSNITGITGNYSNSNVASYLPTYTGDISANNISVTANVVSDVVSAGYFYVTGNITASFPPASPAPYLTGFDTVAAISILGNIVGDSATYLHGDGSNITGIASSYGDSNVTSLLSGGTVSTPIITTSSLSGSTLSLDTGAVTTSSTTGSVPAGLSATNHGATYSSNSPVSVGGSISFVDTSQQYVTYPASSLSLGTSDYTVEFNMYMASTIVNNVTRIYSVAGDYFGLSIEGGSTRRLYVWGTGLTFGFQLVPPFFDTWVNVAVVRSQLQTSVYVNGVSQISFNDPVSYNFTGLDIGIGAQIGNTGIPQEDTYFRGQLTNFRISNVARYTTDFTPSTTPLTTDESTLLLLNALDSGTFLDDTAPITAPDTWNINYGGNTWAYSNVGGLSVTGNISANYLFGNAAHLIGLPGYGNSSVADFLAAGSPNAIVSVEGVYGSYLQSYGDIQADANVIVLDSITATNTVTGSAFIGNVGEPIFNIISSDANVDLGNRYGVNTGGGAVTVTLPAVGNANLFTGGAVFFTDAGFSFATNNLTVYPNGESINGVGGNLVLNTNGSNVGLFWSGTSWITY